jgi:hypothetical protein
MQAAEAAGRRQARSSCLSSFRHSLLDSEDQLCSVFSGAYHDIVTYGSEPSLLES